MFQAKAYYKMQIGLGVMLVAAVLLTLAAAVWPLASVQAAGGEGPSSAAVSPYAGCWFDWLDTGICCDSPWWPGKQDLEMQWVICPGGYGWPTGETRCHVPSICP